MKISPIDTFINEKFTILASDIKFRLRQEYLNINKNRNIQPLIKEEEKLEMDSTKDYVNKVLAATHKSELDDIITMKNKKSIKKTSNE